MESSGHSPNSELLDKAETTFSKRWRCLNEHEDRKSYNSSFLIIVLHIFDHQSWDNIAPQKPTETKEKPPKNRFFSKKPIEPAHRCWKQTLLLAAGRSWQVLDLYSNQKTQVKTRSSKAQMNIVCIRFVGCFFFGWQKSEVVVFFFLKSIFQFSFFDS